MKISLRAAGAMLALAASAAASLAAGDLDVAIGKAVFDRLWVPAPASTRSADGLGPLFAARSCASCHPRGGRAAFGPQVEGLVEDPGLVVRLGLADGTPHATYGAELQTRGAPGQLPEGAPHVRWVSASVDGRTLRKPAWSVRQWGYGKPGEDLRMSARLAPTLVGVAEIGLVKEAAILAAADPDDRDGDGISGRPSMIPMPDGTKALGRFGWKADEPSLLAQTASAFALDLGLSTPLLQDAMGDCTARQSACRAAPSGADEGGVEVDRKLLMPLVDFLWTLYPPKAAPADPAGERLFASTGCASCHTPKLAAVDGTDIALHSDLLLHDMGAGLDDGLPGRSAASSEWRTAPLRGTAAVLAARGGLLHDGRAADVATAVLWHGGEAARARAAFAALGDAERAALLHYIEGL